MDILSLITGALLIAAGFISGIIFCGKYEDNDGYRELYQKEYAKNNGLYEPIKR